MKADKTTTTLTYTTYKARKQRLGTVERVVLGVSLLGLIVSGLLFLNDDFYRMAFGTKTVTSNKRVIGRLVHKKKDTRVKDSSSFVWQKAYSDQELRSGDGVFVGRGSEGRIELNGGHELKLGENTLVNFSNQDGVDTPDLSFGEFKLNVNGEMKIAIQGEVVEFKGKEGSEVEVFIDNDKKPQLRLVKGEVDVKPKSQPTIKLTKPNTVATIVPKEVAKESAPKEDSLALIAKQADAPLVTPTTGVESYSHIDRLEDHYERGAGSAWSRRSTPLATVPLQATIAWSRTGTPAKIFIQHSNRRDFAGSRPVDTNLASSWTLSPLFVGENYWRVSTENSQWSEPQGFTVNTRPLDTEAPRIILEQEGYDIVGGPVEVSARLASMSNFNAFVLEASSDPTFPIDATAVEFLKTSEVKLSASTPGSLYLRVRGVNEATQLTAYSPVATVELRNPPLPLEPLLSQASYEVFSGEDLAIAWHEPDRAARFDVRLLNRDGTTIAKRTQKNNSVDWTPLEPGSYSVRVWSIDRWNRRSVDHARALITVKPRPLSLLARSPHEPLPEPTPNAEDRVVKADREPSATGSSTAELEIPTYNLMNEKYRSSKIQLEGAGFTMYSKEELKTGHKPPTAMTLTARFQHWWKKLGIEGSFKSKVVDIQAHSSGSPSPLQLEARAHYRFNLPYNPFSTIQDIQVSGIAGYESYQNNGTGLWSPGYDLFKAGVKINFPLRARFDTGGEVLYGMGADNSKKYEISGNAHVYLKKNISIGGGYRVHLFEAGSDKTTPLGLPYREGYGEGYSVLRWHY